MSFQLIQCALCEEEFNPNSREKKLAGGLRIHCPDCSEETAVKYAGVSSGEGKQGSVAVLKFNSETDRAAYISYWQNNSGLHKNKGCQIGRGLKTTPAISFKTMAIFKGNENHKGKA